MEEDSEKKQINIVMQITTLKIISRVRSAYTQSPAGVKTCLLTYLA